VLPIQNEDLNSLDFDAFDSIRGCVVRYEEAGVQSLDLHIESQTSRMWFART